MAEPKQLRLFIGIPLPEALSDQLSTYFTNTFASLPNQKAVVRSNYHITLKFLGSTDESAIPKIHEFIAATEASLSSPPPITLQDIVAFPQPTKAFVLAVGVDATSSDWLKSFVTILENKLSTLNIPREKRTYHPHLTIARFTKATNISALSPAPPPQLTISTPNITLFQSQTLPSGPIYKKVPRTSQKVPRTFWEVRGTFFV